ncbi:MAG TPA: PKD domain-containing protein [Polyangiales bacterium]|nr:PKD domain-containing protein [Polyangiales bacterium]
MSRKYRRWGILALAVLLWVVCLWGLQKPRDSASHAREAAPLHTGQRAASEPKESSKHRDAKAVQAGPSMPALRTADLIADVHVDKQRVCAGESFLVNIKGKPENARSSLPIAELNFNIGGTFGNDIAISPLSAGTEQYTVVAGNGVDKIEHRTFNVEVLPSDAPECASRAFVTLAVERAKHDPNIVVARVVARRGLDESAHYSWSFGDGASDETSEPVATHSYALREQTRTLSSYLVSVTARDARGRQAEGRATISLQNNHYKARMFGARLVQATYDHFPAAEAADYRVDVTLRSFEPEPVVLSRARLVERNCFAGQRDRTHELTAAELTGSTRLPPEQANQVTLRIPKALVGEDTCAIALELIGDTVPPRTDQLLPNSPIKLRPVTSRIDLEIKAAPSAEQGGSPTLARRAVRDPALLKKLRRATELLGSDRVTPAQLEQLERDGRL